MNFLIWLVALVLLIAGLANLINGVIGYAIIEIALSLVLIVASKEAI